MKYDRFVRQRSALLQVAKNLEVAKCAEIWADGEVCISCGIQPGEPHLAYCDYLALYAITERLLRKTE